MSNQDARTLLSQFAEVASSAARIATWAEAFLQEGGEPTWDAIKSVSSVAFQLEDLSAQVHGLEARYEQILP